MRRPGTFDVVEEFERQVAEFTGARHCVAVSTGTNAIFLALRLERIRLGPSTVTCPARTFVSVPMQVLHARFALRLIDMSWHGTYRLNPTRVHDSALRFRRGMFDGGLECLSFHARKHLNIGEGGAVITDDDEDAEWLRAARNSGRQPPDFKAEDVTMLGWNFYMTPEKAARGLHLLTYLPGDLPDQVADYPDLRQCPVFRTCQ